MMLLYRGQSCSEILLCFIYSSLRNLEQFLLCVWKLYGVQASKHRILHLNYLFNNYNVVIPRSILIKSISMLKINILMPLEPIPTLHLEAMRGLIFEMMIIFLKN